MSLKAGANSRSISPLIPARKRESTSRRFDDWVPAGVHPDLMEGGDERIAVYLCRQTSAALTTKFQTVPIRAPPRPAIHHVSS